MNGNAEIDKNGFTIVELLVVIVVIGILAAISIVSYTGISQKAASATLQSDLAGISQKLKLYSVLYGSYPTALDINDCPSAPTANSEYCLKPSNGNSINYNGSTDNFSVTAANGATYYRITDDSSPIAASSLDWGLIAHWTMDEGSGSSVIDSSGKGRTGTWSGTSTHYAAGKIGSYSGQFLSSNNDFVIINPVPTYQNFQEMSYSFWDIPTDTSGDHAVVTYGGNLCQSITTQIKCWVNTSNQSFIYTRTATASWEHVVVTISFVTNEMKTYLNGQLQQTDTITTTLNTGNWTEIYIGQYRGDTRRFSGQIDDVRIYDRILSDGEIQELYNT
jgi:prepilin-type N-terminal cleavage/methylation domain-containing protein